jgi:predicted ArsR family transcriptional regulator
MNTDTSARVLYALKSRGPLATHDMARGLGITDVGMRQHLAKLHGDGLVTYDDRPGEVGRPKRIWRLTAKGQARQETMVATYRQVLEALSDLGDRVRTLARLRTVEGYMAQAERQKDGSFLLIEDHCPICAAAAACQGFCRSELEVFEAAFGRDVSVTRQEHLLSGGRRCVYRIAPTETQQ